MARVLPAFVPPMTATVVRELPEGGDWVYEVKLDGYRALILKHGSRVEIRSRNNKDLTRTYSGVSTAARSLRADAVLLDGEIVAVDGRGHPSFQALQHRGAHPDHTVVFYAFDLLHLDGRDPPQAHIAPRDPLPVQRSPEQQDLTLGRRRDARADARDAVAQTEAGGADPVRRVDG